MDNAPAHSSRIAKDYIEQNGIFHFATPAQSPDLNPIEMVWHDMKIYIQEKVKPRNALELRDGIYRFWNTKVTVAYCNAKINHVRDKVIDAIIKLHGKPTGL